MATFIGTPWNTDMPTLGHGVRKCPKPGCNFEGDVKVVAYDDAENWTCPRCGTRVEGKPENGRFGSKVEPTVGNIPDRTRAAYDTHRTVVEDKRGNQHRLNLTPQRRRALGLD